MKDLINTLNTKIANKQLDPNDLPELDELFNENNSCKPPEDDYKYSLIPEVQAEASKLNAAHVSSGNPIAISFTHIVLCTLLALAFRIL
jgi:hypothetical protein